MVMVYTGYDLAARLFGFGDLPRYGAGVVALYGGLGELFGAHHSVIIAANRVMGALMSVSLLSLVVSVVGARRVGVLIAMSLVLGLPIVWRDQMSEAIMTGSASLLITGLAAVVMGVLHEEARPLSWLGLAPLAAASVCRPEAPGAIACVLLGLLLVRRGRGDALALAAIMALALVPQLGWFDAVIAREVAADGIIAPSTALSERLSDVLVRRNLFVFGPWLSSFSLVWVVVACWRGGRHRWLCLSLVAAAVAWIGASSVDLPDVSIPRVHLPALFLVLPVMAVGAQRLSNRPHLQGSIVGLVALHAALSIGPVYEPSNADHEERLIRLAQAHAPAPGGCVTTIHFEDPPDVGHTQRHFPVYLFEGRTFSGLEAFDQVWPTCGGRAIVILGARCYMDYREPGEPVVPGAGVVEACAAFRDRYQLRPIEEVTITNRTRWTFEMYPDTPTLELGLYEVLARNIEVESEDSMEKPNERQ